MAKQWKKYKLKRARRARQTNRNEKALLNAHTIDMQEPELAQQVTLGEISPFWADTCQRIRQNAIEHAERRRPSKNRIRLPSFEDGIEATEVYRETVEVEVVGQASFKNGKNYLFLSTSQ